MDPDKIRGDIQRPIPQQELEKSDKVDPEKFKRVMKVDESDETQKRNKRNLKREEEEGEDDKTELKAPPSPTSSFSEFMQDKDELDSVFDKQSGGVRHQPTEKNASYIAYPSPGEISTEGVELEEEPSVPSTSFSPSSSGSGTPPRPQASPQEQLSTGYSGPSPISEPQQTAPIYEGMPSPSVQEQQSQTPPPSSAQSEQEQQVETPPEEQQTDQETGKKAPKQKHADASLLSSQPTKQELESLKRKKEKKVPEAEIKPSPKQENPPAALQTQKEEKTGEMPHSKTQETPSSGKESHVLGKGAAESTPNLSAEKGPEESFENLPQQSTEQQAQLSARTGEANEAKSFVRYTPEEIRSQRLSEAAQEDFAVPKTFEGEKGETGHDKKRHKDKTFPEATLETAGIPLPTSEPIITPTAPTEEIPSYSKLSPEVHELFEKMAGVILIQQDKGVTTTTMDINLPNSVFNGAQVIINHYSTAPNAYNIQLTGSPEAVKLFSQNLDTLKDSFKQGNYNFEANILTPAIQSGKKPHLIRRKGAAGDEGGGNSKQQNKG